MQLAKVEPFNAVEPLDDDLDFSLEEIAEEELKVSAIDTEPSDLTGSSEDPMGAEAHNGLVRLATFIKEQSSKLRAQGIDPKVRRGIKAYSAVQAHFNLAERPGTQYKKSA